MYKRQVLLAKLLPRLQAEGHKVLIFSQMVRCLDLIEVRDGPTVPGAEWGIIIGHWTEWSRWTLVGLQ